jgi:hypothetical protein
VRTQPSYDDLLEPLPVVVDGVLVEPAYAASAQPLRQVVPHTVEAVDAMCTKILERRGLAALAPWLGPQSSMSETQPPTPPTTFSRIIELDPARLASLPAWWERHAGNERLVIAHRLSLSVPRRTADDVWSMGAALRSPGPVRPVRMELSMWRHLRGWTKLTLAPRRRVFTKGLYFRNGHRTLDLLCEQLMHELPDRNRETRSEVDAAEAG